MNVGAVVAGCAGTFDLMMNLILIEVAVMMTAAYVAEPTVEPVVPVQKLFGVAADDVAPASDWLVLPAAALVLAAASEWLADLLCARASVAFDSAAQTVEVDNELVRVA